MIDWDDGEKTEWIGPVNSGEGINLVHSWNQKGTYIIKAWAKDSLEGESGQASFRLNILTDKSKQSYTGLIQFLEILMNRFPLLTQIIQNR
jgi:hypothetical protein